MLREQLTEALKTAMRSRDAETVGAIRLILSALKDKDIAARPSGNTTGIGDPEILALLQSMVKQRRESITLYRQGNREDLVAKEEAEIAVIERFMPRQLDAAETEAAIQASLDRLMREAHRTCLVIAHRFSTVRDADLVLVLDKGRLVAQGTHDTLIASSPLYQDILGMQFEGGRTAAPAGELS